eukprot:g1992.t1
MDIISLKGKLRKRGDFLNRWRLRYFELTENGLLHYWAEEEHASGGMPPRGTFELRRGQFKADFVENIDAPGPAFSLTGAARPYRPTFFALSEKSSNSAEKWVSALNVAAKTPSTFVSDEQPLDYPPPESPIHFQNGARRRTLSFPKGEGDMKEDTLIPTTSSRLVLCILLTAFLLGSCAWTLGSSAKPVPEFLGLTSYEARACLRHEERVICGARRILYAYRHFVTRYDLPEEAKSEAAAITVFSLLALGFAYIGSNFILQRTMQHRLSLQKQHGEQGKAFERKEASKRKLSNLRGKKAKVSGKDAKKTILKFEEASARARDGFLKSPSQSELLTLYGYFKQATIGDACDVEEAPSRWNMSLQKAYAKWEAHNRERGTTQLVAMQKYCKYFEDLEANYGCT